MLQSIFYKEWIKSRRVVYLCLLVSVAFVLYTQIRIGRAIELQGEAHIWLVMLIKDVVFVEILKYVPLAIGLLMALAQFVPEMQQKRLKLTLHLPFSQKRVMAAIVLFGLGTLLLIFAINYLWLWLWLNAHFAPAFVSHMLLTTVPWYLAGVAGYAFAAWICVEPTWKYRVVATLFAVGYIRVLFLSPYPQAYNTVLWIFSLLTILFTAFVWMSVVRFKEGKQD